LIASDNFNRANNTDPGCKWLKLGSSDWRIVANQLRCASEGPLITTVRPVDTHRPTSTQSARYALRLSVTLTGSKDGVTAWGVIVGYKDENNFIWLKFEYDEGPPEYVWPAFMQRSGGVDTVLLDKNHFDPPDEAHPFVLDENGEVDLTICYGRQDWTVFGDNEETAWTLCGYGNDELPDDSRVGLVGFLKGRFDGWGYYVHWEADTECDYCSCFCMNPNDEDDFACLPETLTLTFVPDPGNAFACPSMDNRSITFKQGKWDVLALQILPSPTKDLWVTEQEGFPPEPHGEPRSHTFQCSDSLVIDIFPAAFVFVRPPSPDWSRSTCKPLYLVYPQVMPEADEECEPDMIRATLCPDMTCPEDTEENMNKIYAMRWTPILTA
jgi:hypothetical protein